MHLRHTRHQSRAVSLSVGLKPPRSVGSIPRAIHRDLASSSRERRRGTVVEGYRRKRTGGYIPSIRRHRSNVVRCRRSTRVIARRERIDPRADVLVAAIGRMDGTRRRARCETYLGGGLGGERGGENGRHVLRCGRACVRVCGGGGRDAVERRVIRREAARARAGARWWCLASCGWD